MTDDAFVHMTSGAQTATVVEETLRRLGREEPVVSMRDSFEAGPLGDVDAGARSRIEWHARLRGEPVPENEARELHDADLWQRVRGMTVDVMLWHGPHPAERIFALRACWHLRDQPERLHEVALRATGRTWRGSARPAFYDALGIVGPNEAVPAWERRARVVDVPERAKRWEELRDKPGEWVRVLEGEEIRELPLTAWDREIIEACSGDDWADSLKLSARIIANNALWLSLVSWRIRELLRTGVLEGRGPENRIGLPTDLRLRV
jgi:hypothetical protein